MSRGAAGSIVVHDAVRMAAAFAAAERRHVRQARLPGIAAPRAAWITGHRSVPWTARANGTQMHPRVSVVLPTHDRAAYLGAAVESVLRQTFGDLELIVVDDGSTDATPDVLDRVRDPRLRVIRQAHRGIDAAMNAGLRAARGEYLARNDSDDLWLPGLLATLVPALDLRRDAGFAYARCRMIDGRGAPLPGGRGFPLRFPDDGLRSLLWADYTASITTVFRRTCLERAGGFDESLLTDGDWDAALRVARWYPIVFVDRVLALVRIHGANVTAASSPRREEYIRSRRQVLDKVFADPDLPPGIAAMRPIAYRNLHVGEGLQLLALGRRAGALRAFGRAVREGGNPAASVARIVWSATVWFGVHRFAWSGALARRLATAWRTRRVTVPGGAPAIAVPVRTRPRPAAVTAPLATVVVVPRERFHLAPQCLDRLYAETAGPFDLVYVDGRSPRRVRRHLERRAAERGFALVRSDRYLSPNEARNLGAARVRTKYIAFIDNDVMVTPDWLAALVRCAEETGAWLCGPLCLIGPLEEQRIHMAGGSVHVVAADGRRIFHDAHRSANVPIGDVRHALRREQVELVEFHCMLVRTEVFDRLGPLDEGLLSVLEHCDLCLAVGAAGGTVYFEPASVVAHIPPPPVAWPDIPYFVLRWSEEWTRASVERFATKWRLDPNGAGFEETVSFARHRRRVALDRARAVYRRLHGPGAARVGKRVLGSLERALGGAVVRWERSRRSAAAAGRTGCDARVVLRPDEP
jgi:GT2 family glycosyltransferase